MKYIILTCDTDQPYLGCAVCELAERVQDKIAQGWEPLGGPFAFESSQNDYANKMCGQAMIKRDVPRVSYVGLGIPTQLRVQT